MVNCDYCGKEIKRLVFCSPSHKVMYHRRLKQGVVSIQKKAIKIAMDKKLTLCKHGRMLGLCEFGCT